MQLCCLLCWIVCPFLGIILFFLALTFQEFFLHKQLLRFPQGIRKKNNHKLYGSPDQFKQTNVYCDLRVKICLFLHTYKQWARKWKNRAKKKNNYINRNHFYSTIGPFGVAHIRTFNRLSMTCVRRSGSPGLAHFFLTSTR